MVESIGVRHLETAETETETTASFVETFRLENETCLAIPT